MKTWVKSRLLHATHPLSIIRSSRYIRTYWVTEKENIKGLRISIVNLRQVHLTLTWVISSTWWMLIRFLGQMKCNCLHLTITTILTHITTWWTKPTMHSKRLVDSFTTKIALIIGLNFSNKQRILWARVQLFQRIQHKTRSFLLQKISICFTYRLLSSKRGLICSNRTWKILMEDHLKCNNLACFSIDLKPYLV